MKHSDIIKLETLGLITGEQRQKIIDTLKLKEEEGGKLLLILSMVGAVMVVAGIILLISANWDAIHRSLKLAAGLVLLGGAWAGGWYLREVQGVYRKAGEALYLVGAGLWLANIALVGQIYHLSSHPPNAILLWVAGIAALPWLLRSKALFVLNLLAAGLWLGMEANASDSWFGTRWDESQMALYALAGLLTLGWGYVLRAGRWSDFAGPAEKTGLLALLGSLYPLCWNDFGHRALAWNTVLGAVLTGLAILALVLVAFGLRSPRLELDRQWRWTWGLALAGLAAVTGLWLVLAGDSEPYRWNRVHGHYYSWGISIALFVFALLQVQVGIALRSRFMINLAVAIIALVILACYVNLFGSMADTGWMFLISGLFLIGFGIYLEKKRRSLMARLRSNAASSNA